MYYGESSEKFAEVYVFESQIEIYNGKFAAGYDLQKKATKKYLETHGEFSQSYLVRLHEQTAVAMSAAHLNS